MALVRALSSDPFYITLGKIARYSAELHLCIDDLINGMFAGEGAGIDCLISDMSFANMMHAAKALTDRLVAGKKEFIELNKLLDEAQKLYETRNKMVHGIWLLHPTNALKMDCVRFRAKSELRLFRDTYMMADMYALVKGLENVREGLSRFMERKRFKTGTMFNEEVGERRLRRRERSRAREQARFQAQQQKELRR